MAMRIYISLLFATMLSMALVAKGKTLGQLDGSEEAVAVYGEVVTRFGDAAEPALQEPVARALELAKASRH
jgi:hypothetical protein